MKQRVHDKMESIITRRIHELPADMQNIYETNPFGSRLVPNEIWKGSKFERSFVTSFGQGVYEQIAYEIAIGSNVAEKNQHVEQVALNTWQR
ncbi:MAG: TdeIII family type II restriction endonuclease [Eubacteriales bacterium]